MKGCPECTKGFSFYLGRNWPCQFCNAENEDTLDPDELFNRGPGGFAGTGVFGKGS